MSMFNKGANDAAKGLGPASTNGMHWTAAQQYNAGYASGKK